MIKISPAEWKVLAKLCVNELHKDLIIERKSEKEFDLNISGQKRDDNSKIFYGFSAWLPLYAIGELGDWTDLAPYSDYPSMVANGDWSGIRDSAPEKIWQMFHMVINDSK